MRLPVHSSIVQGIMPSSDGGEKAQAASTGHVLCGMRSTRAGADSITRYMLEPFIYDTSSVQDRLLQGGKESSDCAGNGIAGGSGPKAEGQHDLRDKKE